MTGPYDVGAAFAAIEDELTASMMRNMARHRVEEVREERQWAMWQSMQLKALERYRRTDRKRYGRRFQEMNGQIGALIRQARDTGGMEQEIAILRGIQRGYRFPHMPERILEVLETIDGASLSQKIPRLIQSIRSGRIDPLTGAFFRLNERKLEALIRATTHDMEKAETAILRMANDQYRRAIFNAQMYANTGSGTYEKAVDMATRDMLAAGLNCVEYKNGARHTLADYADMAVRTACKRAYLQGEGTKRQEWGISTVIMNKRGNPCPKCLPFCGKVMIDDVWSGGKRSDGPYPLMSSAIAAGLYHPRCKDSHTTYFPGISTADDTWTDEELKKVEEASRQEARQQYARRQAERYGRLARYSLDEEDRERYYRKAAEWEKRVEKSSDPAIIMSGARITDPFSKEAEAFAEMYYEEIRSFSTDVRKIADNLGKDEADIKKIKAYLFEEDSLFDPDTGGYRRFDPDCAIAQSWQRLMIGKDIRPHDRTLIEHELLEMKIKKENPEIEHWKAHELATKKFDYPSEAMEYYGNLEKHKKIRR